MNADHRELRSALERFWEAKRALQQAYRRSVAYHPPAESRRTLERPALEHAANHPATSDEFEGMKDENRALRKSLALLLAHSLGLQDRLDALLRREHATPCACEVAASRAREALRAGEHPGPSTGALDDAYN
jgi:hypothetical protein